MRLGETQIGLDAFCASVESGGAVEIPVSVTERLQAARVVVDNAAAGVEPVYGLNTGLGANLGHRVAPEEIAKFQSQIIEGRAMATGAPLPENTGRSVLLARLISAANGHSGLSVPMYEYLSNVYASGLSPVIPSYGSIGESDLTQNACWALALLGQGQFWSNGEILEADHALAKYGLTVPELQPKDGMALINHGGVTTALSAFALHRARTAMGMVKASALLSYAGYDANCEIFSHEINALRISPGQAEMAVWFAERLNGTAGTHRRVQESLSFRLVAPVLGAAQEALDRAEAIWTEEVNGTSDSPVVLGDHAMCSTPNFGAPALSLALEGVALALSMVAGGAVQRIQRMMNPDFSGLPRYLTPVGGASAGMVPLQKTAAALFGDIRRHAMPVAFDPAPVSDAVEDIAAMTPAVALKLTNLLEPFELLCGAEALVAAQAIDLRQGLVLQPAVSHLHSAIRDEVAMLSQDRPLGNEINVVSQILSRHEGQV